MKKVIVPVAAALLAALPRAQSPQLRLDPAVSLVGGPVTVTFDIAAAAGSPYAIFLDLSGGPVDILGERLWLGLTPSLWAMAAGLMPAAGTQGGSYGVPLVPGLAGLVLYGQGVVLDAAAPNQLFRVTGGASTAFYSGLGAVVADFTNPVVSGFTGTFASDLVGRVRGGAVTTRTHRTIDPSSLFFNLPIQSPLSPYGLRQQMVYRAQDVGASGEPELLTAVRWHAHPSIPVTLDTHSLFELRAGHTAVTPDYSVDPFSALPVAPLSGLSTTFAANVSPLAPPQVLYAGAYIVDPTQMLPGGYMPYPLAAPFRYDGLSSLLLEFRVGPSTANGVNGGVVRLMVQSSAEPYGRVLAAGTASSFLVPSATTTAMIGDNAMHDLELVFARVETFCLSPWLDSNRPSPDYQAPILATSLPAGTAVTAEYRGSSSPTGVNPTAWSASPDVADGRRYLQFRLVFRANLVTGERPVVDTLVVPAL